MKDLIRVDFTPPQIQINPADLAHRDSVLAECKTLETVADSDTHSNAVRVGVEIQRIGKVVEASRVAAKAPALAFGKSIDAAAEEYMSSLNAEKSRIGKMITAFTAAEEIKAAAALEAQSKAIQDSLDVENRLRLAQKAALAAFSDPSLGEGAVQSGLNAESALAEQQKRTLELAVQDRPSAPKGKGQVNRKDLKYEVLDVRLLFKSRPELCIIEPNRAAIRAIIHPGFICPGLRVWEELNTGFRT